MSSDEHSDGTERREPAFVPLSYAQLESIVSSADFADRASLSEYPIALPDDLFFRLIDDPEPAVRYRIAGQHAATAAQLRRAGEDDFDLLEAMKYSPNAPADALELRSIRTCHDGEPERYLSLRNATLVERRAFLELFERFRADPDDEDDLTLGDVWTSMQIYLAFPRG